MLTVFVSFLKIQHGGKNNATPEFLNLVLFKLKRVEETSSQEKLFLGSPKEEGRGWGEERREAGKRRNVLLVHRTGEPNPSSQRIALY